MYMKKQLGILLFFTASISINAQDHLDSIYGYYKNLDLCLTMNQYSEIYRNNFDSTMGNFQDAGYLVDDYQPFDFFQFIPIPLVGIKFCNNPTTEYGYEQIAIDSSSVDLAYMDGNRLVAWVTDKSDFSIITKNSLPKNQFRSISRAFRAILRADPDLLMVNNTLYFVTKGAFLYLKNRVIYIYLVDEGRVMELNDFLDQNSILDYLINSQNCVQFWASSESFPK